MISQLFSCTLHLADTTLILAQRNSEWCGHGPVLEQDIAITNISLDLLGQARNFYQYASLLYNEASTADKEEMKPLLPHLWITFNRELTEDDLCYLRVEHQFLNLLLTELPNGDWAQTILRQFLFSTFQNQLLETLQNNADEQLAAIAAKAAKETAYHLRWSSEWVIRLGDGTNESRARLLKAVDALWMYTGEMFIPAPYETQMYHAGLIANLENLKPKWQKKVAEVFSEATIPLPSEETTWTQQGGKKGVHTEHLGCLLAEMQHLQRTYPNAVW